MAKRRAQRRINSDEVQGKGSWVLVSALTVKEARTMRKQAEDENFDSFGSGLDLVKAHVLDWNWVDDEDESMPSPRTEPDIVDELTIEEAEFLANALLGEDAETKN